MADEEVHLQSRKDWRKNRSGRNLWILGNVGDKQGPTSCYGRRKRRKESRATLNIERVNISRQLTMQCQLWLKSVKEKEG